MTVTIEDLLNSGFTLEEAKVTMGHIDEMAAKYGEDRGDDNRGELAFAKAQMTENDF